MSVTLTRKQVLSVLDALLNLDGPQSAPFKYGAKTRYKLAKAVRLLSSRFEDMEKVRLGIIRELSPSTFSLPKDDPKNVEYTKRWEAFLDAEPEEIDGLGKFTLAELNLETNELPIAVLAKLGPVLIDDE